MTSEILPLFGGPPSWLSRHTELFRSEQSLRWFLRAHRDRFVEVGALIRLRDAWHVCEPAFTDELLAIGRAAAERAVVEG